MPRLNFAPHTAENLRAVAKELVEMQATIEAAATFMDGGNLEVLEIPHKDSRRLGMEKLATWVDAVRAAVLRTKEERGDFSSEKTDKKPPAKSKK